MEAAYKIQETSLAVILQSMFVTLHKV